MTRILPGRARARQPFARRPIDGPAEREEQLVRDAYAGRLSLAEMERIAPPAWDDDVLEFAWAVAYACRLTGAAQVPAGAPFVDGWEGSPSLAILAAVVARLGPAAPDGVVARVRRL